MRELFARSAREYEVETVLADGVEDLFKAVLSIINAHSLGEVVIAGFPADVASSLAEWLIMRGVEARVIDGVEVKEAIRVAERAGGGIVLSYAGVAETGTVIILDGVGSILASTLPPTLIAVLEEERILQSYADLSGLMRSMSSRHGLIHLITGPSGTADIELSYVKGVHGPREVVVLLYRGGGLGGP